MAEFRKSFSRPANLKSCDMQKIKELYERLENKEDNRIVQARLAIRNFYVLDKFNCDKSMKLLDDYLEKNEDYKQTIHTRLDILKTYLLGGAKKDPAEYQVSKIYKILNQKWGDCFNNVHFYNYLLQFI